MIVIEKLSKKYGAVQAVDNLNLTVNSGETFGFLGPNGAGKTTTIRILTTLTKPDSGRVLIDGMDVARRDAKAKQQFGVLQQHFSMDREINVFETMVLHARIYGLKKAQYLAKIDELLEYVELADVKMRVVEDLSGGMKRRLQIARALLHEPKLLLLDEPTVGLDAQTRRRIWSLIRNLNGNGVTVFLTTHYIEEAEALCNRVGIMDHGHLIALGTPKELRGKLGMAVVETETPKGTRYRYFPNRQNAREYMHGLPKNSGSITLRRSNLEDVFIELTGRKVSE
jgi:ABC-2 type transport system ATP-binding protein